MFLARYPEINIDLGVTDRAVNLVGESVDCVLRVGPLSDSGLIARAIGDLPLINVASRAYLDTYGTPLLPSDLEHHLAVNYASPSNGRVEEWEWEMEGILQSAPMRGRVTVNSAEAYIACCLAGMGLIQIPAYDVADQLQSGDLVEVMHAYRAAPMPMTLLYSHREHISRRVQVFVDWLDELLKRVCLQDTAKA